MTTTYVIQFKTEGDGNWYTNKRDSKEDREFQTLNEARAFMVYVKKQYDEFGRLNRLHFWNIFNDYAPIVNPEWRVAEKNVTVQYTAVNEEDNQ